MAPKAASNLYRVPSAEPAPQPGFDSNAAEFCRADAPALGTNGHGCAGFFRWRAARLLTKILTDASGATGIYYDQDGQPMPGSERIRDPKFTARVVAETRALLATVPA